jgi:Holliday junction resolvase RusA-like endonuclease
MDGRYSSEFFDATHPRLGFTILGPPVPMARARVFARVIGGRTVIRAANPANCVKYQKVVRTIAAGARARHNLAPGNQLPWPLVGEFALTLRVFWHDRRRRDLDNIAKAVADACTGVLWNDDSQVSELHVYGALDRVKPRVEVTASARASARGSGAAQPGGQF